MLALFRVLSEVLKRNADFVPVKLHELNPRQSFWVTITAVVLGSLPILLVAMAVVIWACRK